MFSSMLSCFSYFATTGCPSFKQCGLIRNIHDLLLNAGFKLVTNVPILVKEHSE